VALHSHAPRRICGRDEERRVIQRFCAQKLTQSGEENENINNPCLYIYGAPGTGQYKTIHGTRFSHTNFEHVFDLILLEYFQAKRLS
jgi:Cdc6-like AAA superfamily ATPase